MSACPSCGTPPARDDQHFCAKCGTNLAPVEPPAAYGPPTRITGPLFADDVPPPPPPPAAFPLPPPPVPAAAPYVAAPPARRRTPVVLLVVAALVAALIGAGGVVLLFGGDDERADDPVAEDRTSSGPSTAPTTAVGTPTATASETATEDPAAFRCWNGGEPVTRLSSCPLPSGPAGLVWVFPASDGATCTTESGAQRAAETDCYPVVGGAELRVHYSQWRSRAALETYYGANTLAPIGAPGGRTDLTAVQVGSRDSSVAYKVALYYRDPSALWSVTVYAADEAQYLAALDQLDIRPYQQLRGKRA